ncbi:MAG: FliM/FliN family flagellar motor switch protein [Cyanobacteria bacterium NC_groundwater_1444_Ag_S-0.65um_54_12]|nr:FliM/FliN family flagellar motor switch protein [Cyanobacteria bacterium NC_groundwater_1444_Ag_S-0.65um_54_12]
MSKISAQAMFATARMHQSEEYKVRLHERVVNTFVPFAVLLGSSHVNLGDIISLQVGDILPLDQDTQRDLPIVIGEVVKFRGRPGTIRNRMAVQITEVISREKEPRD